MALLTMSSRTSVDRAPAWCLGGYGFDSCWGLRLFSLSHACDMMNISSFIYCKFFFLITENAVHSTFKLQIVPLNNQTVISLMITEKGDYITGKSLSDQLGDVAQNSHNFHSKNSNNWRDLLFVLIFGAGKGKVSDANFMNVNILFCFDFSITKLKVNTAV